MKEWRIGTIEKVQFTQGGAGNQWTMIDGTRYATWWDYRDVRAREGAKVAYMPYMSSLWPGNDEIPCAHVVSLQTAIDRLEAAIPHEDLPPIYDELVAARDAVTVEGSTK